MKATWPVATFRPYEQKQSKALEVNELPPAGTVFHNILASTHMWHIGDIGAMTVERTL